MIGPVADESRARALDAGRWWMGDVACRSARDLGGKIQRGGIESRIVMLNIEEAADGWTDKPPEPESASLGDDLGPIGGRRDKVFVHIRQERGFHYWRDDFSAADHDSLDGFRRGSDGQRQGAIGPGSRERVEDAQTRFLKP